LNCPVIDRFRRFAMQNTSRPPCSAIVRNPDGNPAVPQVNLAGLQQLIEYLQLLCHGGNLVGMLRPSFQQKPPLVIHRREQLQQLVIWIVAAVQLPCMIREFWPDIKRKFKK
jgi:hypothetical protein